MWKIAGAPSKGPAAAPPYAASAVAAIVHAYHATEGISAMFSQCASLIGSESATAATARASAEPCGFAFTSAAASSVTPTSEFAGTHR